MGVLAHKAMVCCYFFFFLLLLQQLYVWLDLLLFSGIGGGFLL